MAHARSFEMPGYTGAVLGVLMLGAWLGMSILHVAAQERSTSVGGGKAGGGEATSPPAGGRGRSSSKGARPPAVPCPSGPLEPTVALPAEQLSTLTFESPKLNDKGNTVETVKGETQRFVEDLGNQVTLELVAVPGGCFTMGNTVSDESESYDNERPPMRARVFGFYMGRTEVTQAQWREVASWPKVERDLPSSPSKYTGDDLPVDSITWDEAVEFCRRLTKRTGQPKPNGNTPAGLAPPGCLPTARFCCRRLKTTTGLCPTGTSQPLRHAKSQRRPDRWGLMPSDWPICTATYGSGAWTPILPA
jgi:hypothetical protein